MKNWNAIKQRYLVDEVPTRLGGIAANLARVKSFSKNIAHSDLVVSLVEESKIFIEWTANDADIDTAGELVERNYRFSLHCGNCAGKLSGQTQRNGWKLQHKHRSGQIGF